VRHLPALDALRLAAGFAGVFGFAIGFSTPCRFAVIAACTGAVSNTARLTAIGLHMPEQFAAVGATFIVGVAASIVSPRIIMSVPAVGDDHDGAGRMVGDVAADRAEQ
jgi:uncharacterized membrane protein YjjB (DUF3815 family)